MNGLSSILIACGLVVSAHAEGTAQLESTIERIAFQEKAPPELMLAICKVESSLRPTAVNHKDGNGRTSIGLCQIQLRTAQWMGYTGDEKGLYSVESNVKYSARYLAYQLRRYDHVYDYAIAAYNAGSVRRNPNKKLINERYVRKVWAMYRK